MIIEDLKRIAVATALNMGLDPALCCALITNESSWNHEAARYEEGFFNRYIAAMKATISDPVELRLRATSIGLTQIMGQTARELGFDHKSLEELFEPLSNLTFGFRKLRKCLELENGAVHAALLRYNGGGDAHYPDRVMQYYKEYEHLKETK